MDKKNNLQFFKLVRTSHMLYLLIFLCLFVGCLFMRNSFILPLIPDLCLSYILMSPFMIIYHGYIVVKFKKSNRDDEPPEIKVKQQEAILQNGLRTFQVIILAGLSAIVFGLFLVKNNSFVSWGICILIIFAAEFFLNLWLLWEIQSQRKSK